MAKGSNDERLVIRMPKELRDWIDAQADEVGLDAAAWVRMQLTQAMRGKPAAAPSAIAYQPGAALMLPAEGEPVQPLDPAALDALVEEGLATADAQGLTQSVESAEDVPQTETMRIGERSRATMRNLVGNGAPRPW